MNSSTMAAKTAAEYIGVSYWKLLELVKSGRIPHVRIDGRVLFRRETLDNWLAEQEHASIKQPEQSGRLRRLK